jgi:hypothetical protein
LGAANLCRRSRRDTGEARGESFNVAQPRSDQGGSLADIRPFLIVIGLFIVRQVGLALAFVFVSTALSPVSAFIVGSLLDALVWAMIWMLASIAITVTYMELRRIKEGASVGELAEIFA